MANMSEFRVHVNDRTKHIDGAVKHFPDDPLTAGFSSVRIELDDTNIAILVRDGKREVISRLLARLADELTQYDA